ncbi:iron complex outermembrane receptor protein [Mucilaginibacter frigoritolerans]|uniref:Iron complex outermembrane receptor protein n=1 Tax=Mucilaginibacter frigoritolerans TaxID=652788 RepID=A0A562TU76_9SPHI|nr:TonB-dependent receptor [Mucilaginibacter frigoritolerans]TWI96636.1 iron complex outermembrane receptor protein [Mucilaginibacter frigoritolerans]
MNRIYLLLIFFIVFKVSAQEVSLKGRITSDGAPVSYGTIILSGTTLGSTTNDKGFYEIKNAPAGNYQLIITCIGYQTQKAPVIIKKGVATVQNIELKADANKLNEVVVTGVSKATLIRENPLAMEAVSTKQIDQSAENNTIDAIAKSAPGLQTVKTGPNVSKPFINGLGYNRVLTLYDGLRVETQQWGDEHGVPMDDYIIERAEVIKGPASLMYGSDAIAGVLSLFPAIPKDTDRLIHGRYLSEYQTNNGLIGNSLSLFYGNPHWAWAIRGSERIARSYTDPIDGRVYNTGFKMYNGSAFLGYHNAQGYSHLNFTIYDNRQGIPDGSRDSLTRKFTYQIYESEGENTLLPQVDNLKDRPIVPQNVLNSYNLSPLSQQIQDYRLYTDNFYHLGLGDIKASLGFEQNVRREYDHPTDPDQAGEYIVLNTIDYGLRYNAPSFLNIEPSIGINGMYQTNTNKDATDFPIPAYHLFDAGGYAYLKWKQDRWTIAGGLRYDHRSEDGDEMYIASDPSTGFFRQVPNGTAGAVQQFPAFSLDFQGVSGSIGTTYQINDELSFKTNIARGYRSPNITEIASNGLDPGAHIVYRGNLGFKPEFSLQEDAGLSGTYPNFSFNVTAFNNYIQNFIYEDQEVDKNGNPVVIIPGNRTLQYQSTNAQLYGADATLNIHPEGWKAFHFDNAFSLVYGYNLNPKYKDAEVNGEYLPFIPPPRWLSSISYAVNTNGKTLPSITIKAENDLNLAQNRYLGLYQTETPTAAYDLVNLSVNGDIHYGKGHSIQCLLAVDNLLNTAYQNHLSRLQYFEYYTASPNGHLGIYNMGRNVVFKVIIPF